MSCNRVTDNKFFQCPARMADGRGITDYRPNCLMNNKLIVGQQINNSLDYKQYLVNNATVIMNKQRKDACDINCCTSCGEDTAVPLKAEIECKDGNCDIKQLDMNGVGTGVKVDLSGIECDDCNKPIKSQSDTSCCVGVDNNWEVSGSADSSNWMNISDVKPTKK